MGVVFNADVKPDLNGQYIYIFFFILWFIFCLFWPTQQCSGHCGLEAARRRFHPYICGLAHFPSVCVGSHQDSSHSTKTHNILTRRIRDSKIATNGCMFFYMALRKTEEWFTENGRMGILFLNKNCRIVDAHLSLSKCRERKFTLLEILYNCFYIFKFSHKRLRSKRMQCSYFSL